MKYFFIIILLGTVYAQGKNYSIVSSENIVSNLTRQQIGVDFLNDSILIEGINCNIRHYFDEAKKQKLFPTDIIYCKNCLRVWTLSIFF